MIAKLKGLIPVLSDDIISTRTVLALAVLHLQFFTVEAHDTRSVDSMSLVFRAPLLALSTADVCWALCSEKKKIIMDAMLPGVFPESQWSWPAVKRIGLGWWLCGASNLEIADAVVTNLAKSVMMRLNKANKASRFDDDPSEKRSLKVLTDEAVFWSVMSGANLAKLKALQKTGMLSSDAGIKGLLTHEHSAEPSFLTKNAFRLLQLNRFHLAAALFVLCDSYEEAARVVAGHLRDLQLALLITRRHPEVMAPLLQNHVQESPLVGGDPWLGFLLAWHAGDIARPAAA